MGRAQGVSYFSYETNGCFGVKETRQMPCCSDKLEVIKLEEDQNTATFDLSEKQLYEIKPIMLPAEFVALTFDVEDDEENRFIDDLPPPKNEPIYQLNCSLTYYG